jgi:small neutral amino acid transporter SnatA (MarC family)
MDPMTSFLDSAGLLFVLLNPFLLVVYLLDLVESMRPREFAVVLARAAIVSTLVFVLFAWSGDYVFARVLQVRFAAFMIFGGVVFLIVGLRFVFQGHRSLQGLRGEAGHVAGSIAMPFMIGPGTLSASILAGARNTRTHAALAILAAMALTVAGVLLLKLLHDRVRRAKEELVERYIEIVGRVSALVIGTFAVEMILQGIEAWRAQL